MAAKRTQGLRVMVIVLLALLGLQYEFGMAVNIANPPSLPAFGLSLNAVSNALHQAGVVAVIHASLGIWLVVFSVINLILSLRSGLRSVQVFGSLAFLATLLAAITGLLFTLSGFQNDGDSHGMATNFLLSFTFYFLELSFLKPIQLSS
ncbi:MAG: hypothetical protein ABSA23_17925 [Anaerolineales bacterium]